MKNAKFLPIILLVCLACASYGVKKNTGQEQSVSPGLVKGLRPVGIIGEGKLGSSSFYLPTGIAIDPLGNIFITDTGNDRVVKCDREGRFLAETGGFGWGAGEFNRPTYIATDNGLNVYVVDVQNKRIQRFDQNLNFVSIIEIKEEEDFSGFGLLEGITITSSGEILVSDIEEDHIIKLNSFFEYERSFGGFESIGGGLRDPLGVFVSQKGNVYVADSQNDRVVVFDSFGNFLKSFGEKILNYPNGVTIGQNQLTYVANTGKNSLVVFDPDGNLILEYGNSGAEMEKLSRPTDLKLWKENKLFVVDSGNNRILVFELLR
ncbi:MAG: NHL repeat-containing protein [candidate division Zixibacteria bacterium]|nr:NHL repeat-containing protein [candidate division Zixibacteria bacterium]